MQGKIRGEDFSRSRPQNPSDNSTGLTPVKEEDKNGRLGRKSIRLHWSSEKVSRPLWELKHRLLGEESCTCSGKKWSRLISPPRSAIAWPQANAVLYPEGTEAGGCQLTELLTADHPVLLWKEIQAVRFCGCHRLCRKFSSRSLIPLALNPFPSIWS